MRTLALVGLSAGLLAGCDVFVSPPVLCGSGLASGAVGAEADPWTVELTISKTPPRADQPCEFPEPFPFTVVHAPRIDTARLDPGSKPSQLTLIGAKVTVAQAYGGALVCDKVNTVCKPITPDECGRSSTPVGVWCPEIYPRIAQDGAVHYQGSVSVAAEQVLLKAGETYSMDNRSPAGILLTETYGPGNSCPVMAKITLNCVKQ